MMPAANLTTSMCNAPRPASFIAGKINRSQRYLQLTRKGDILKAGVTIILAAALTVTGSAAADGVNQTMWTTKEMRAGVRALAYPRANPKKISCRGLGTATGGRYSGFKCKTTYRHHRHRSFVMVAGTEGGWICAGRTPHTCHVLSRGFLGSSQASQWGGLGAAAGYSATGYVQEHYSGTLVESASPCSPVGTTAYQCPYSSPTVTVTITYKQVKGGWTIKGAASQ